LLWEHLYFKHLQFKYFILSWSNLWLNIFHLFILSMNISFMVNESHMLLEYTYLYCSCFLQTPRFIFLVLILLNLSYFLGTTPLSFAKSWPRWRSRVLSDSISNQGLSPMTHLVDWRFLPHDPRCVLGVNTSFFIFKTKIHIILKNYKI